MQFTFRKPVNENCWQGMFAICHQKLKILVQNPIGAAHFTGNFPEMMESPRCIPLYRNDGKFLHHLSPQFWKSSLPRPVLTVFNICTWDQRTKHHSLHSLLYKTRRPVFHDWQAFYSHAVVFSFSVSRVSARDTWKSGDQIRRQRRTVSIFRL